MFQFPHEAAFLPRTRLSYVNLPGILSDGKRDRSARVSGYVCIQLGERCYLVFLRGGEPFNAARLTRDARGAAALSEVLRIVGTESERGEGGQIGYYGASEAQLQAMLATLLNEPVAWGEPVDPARPDQLFPRLREKRFRGVLELGDGARHHYMRFEDGAFREGGSPTATRPPPSPTSSARSSSRGERGCAPPSSPASPRCRCRPAPGWWTCTAASWAGRCASWRRRWGARRRCRWCGGARRWPR